MPLEIGLSWHPMFNVPYIPASSIKGAVRAYAEVHNVRPCGESVDKIFGTVGEASIVVVSDAYPVKCNGRLLDLDIVNPHYREVEGVVGEADVSPTPIVYPAIARGVTFGMLLAFRRHVDTRCLLDIWNLLKGAFEEGLGARTRLGYGTLSLTRPR